MRKLSKTRFRDARLAAGIDPTKASKIGNIHPQTLARWEEPTSGAKPDIEAAVNMAEAYGCDILDFFEPSDSAVIANAQ